MRGEFEKTIKCVMYEDSNIASYMYGYIQHYHSYSHYSHCKTRYCTIHHLITSPLQPSLSLYDRPSIASSISSYSPHPSLHSHHMMYHPPTCTYPFNTLEMDLTKHQTLVYTSETQHLYLSSTTTEHQQMLLVS